MNDLEVLNHTALKMDRSFYTFKSGMIIFIEREREREREQLPITMEENIAIFRRYIAEISCIDGFRHDISWRNIGPTIFRDFSRYIAWSTRVNESQTRYSARQRATVMLQSLLQCLTVICC